jgi:hypothetical protein
MTNDGLRGHAALCPQIGIELVKDPIVRGEETHPVNASNANRANKDARMFFWFLNRPLYGPRSLYRLPEPTLTR